MLDKKFKETNSAYIVMTQITNEELIKKAKSVVKSRKIKHGFTVGQL